MKTVALALIATASAIRLKAPQLIKYLHHAPQICASALIFDTSVTWTKSL